MKSIRISLPVFLTATLLGCNNIISTDLSIAKEARVIITGTSSVPLRLLFTRDFTQTRDENNTIQVSIFSLDSMNVTLPFDRKFPFDGSDRYLFRLANRDLNATATVRMQLLVDGKQAYDQSATLRDAYLQLTFFNTQ